METNLHSELIAAFNMREFPQKAFHRRKRKKK